MQGGCAPADEVKQLLGCLIDKLDELMAAEDWEEQEGACEACAALCSAIQGLYEKVGLACDDQGKSRCFVWPTPSQIHHEPFVVQTTIIQANPCISAASHRCQNRRRQLFPLAGCPSCGASCWQPLPT